jgi:hypothetical protein
MYTFAKSPATIFESIYAGKDEYGLGAGKNRYDLRVIPLLRFPRIERVARDDFIEVRIYPHVHRKDPCQGIFVTSPVLPVSDDGAIPSGVRSPRFNPPVCMVSLMRDMRRRFSGCEEK